MYHYKIFRWNKKGVVVLLKKVNFFFKKDYI